MTLQNILDEYYYEFNVKDFHDKVVALALPDDKLMHAFALQKAFPKAVIIEHGCCVESEYPIISMGNMCNGTFYIYPKLSQITDLQVNDSAENALVLGWEYYHIKNYLDFKNTEILSINQSTTAKNVFLYGDLTKVQALKYLRHNLKHRKEEGWEDFDFSFLKARYSLSQKVKMANIIGIIVNKNYIDIAEHLKRVILKSGRKSYYICTKQITPEKLGNFLEVDLFVTVTCPERSFIDPKDYMVPAITPYELIVGLDPEFNWNVNEYEIDAAKLGPFINRLEKNLDSPSHQLEVVNTRYEKGMVKSAAEYLSNRVFRGLELNNDVPVTLVEEGRHGIARTYTHELQ